MESNRDEAAACASRAQQAYAAGDYARAAKLARKSHSMYPTAETQRLSQEYAAAAASAASAAQDSPDSPAPSSKGDSNGQAAAAGAREARRGSGPGSASGAGSAAGKSYTREQALLVETVLRAKSHYEVLGLARDAQVDAAVVTKAYRKLVIKLHPDKNHAPRAKEACAVLNTACNVLSDPQRKRQYDLTGEDQPSGQQVFRRRGGDFGPMFAEDLFSEMFGPHFARQFGARTFHTHFERGNGFHHNGRHRHATHDNGPQRQAEPGGRNQLFMMALMMFFLFVLPSFFSAPGPLFSMQRTGSYTVEHSLPHMPEVKYYVSPDVAESYNDQTATNQRRLRSLENQVLQTHLNSLDRMCKSEKLQAEVLKRRARYNKEAPPHVDMPSCDKLRRAFDRMH